MPYAPAIPELMEESNPQTSSQSKKSALVLTPISLVVKRGQHEELVLPSLPLPVGRREGEELVCGTATALADRPVDRQNNRVEGGPVGSEGEEEQGQKG